MGQVTIYVEDGALDAAKRAAERAKVSVSQWFAKFAVEEKQKQAQGWDDFPSLEEIRAHEVPDSPRESW